MEDIYEITITLQTLSPPEPKKEAPASLLDALDQHLASLEGKKGAATTPTNASK